MELATWATVGSTLISAVALVLTVKELRASHSSREIEGVFEIWDRYKRYVNEYTNAASDPERARIALINLLNFLENSALIYNGARKPRLVKENIRSLLSGYLAMIEENGSIMKILDHFGSPSGNYEELRKFHRRWRKSK